MFPANLLYVFPRRNIDFTINLEPSTKPIFIPPYCMTSAKLKELKERLQGCFGSICEEEGYVYI